MHSRRVFIFERASSTTVRHAIEQSSSGTFEISDSKKSHSRVLRISGEVPESQVPASLPGRARRITFSHRG